LPTPYLDDVKILENIIKWEAEILNYDIYSLSIQMYHGIIFEKFVNYCKSK